MIIKSQGDGILSQKAFPSHDVVLEKCCDMSFIDGRSPGTNLTIDLINGHKSRGKLDDLRARVNASFSSSWHSKKTFLSHPLR